MCTRKLDRVGEKDILQCVTKWMAKNTVPVTIWGVPIWKGGGRQKNTHLGTPRNHEVFVTIWGLIFIHIFSLGSYVLMWNVSSKVRKE